MTLLGSVGVAASQLHGPLNCQHFELCKVVIGQSMTGFTSAVVVVEALLTKVLSYIAEHTNLWFDVQE